jgi:hypothetical protein
MGQTSRVVAVGLVGRKRLQRLIGVPAIHTTGSPTATSPW